MLTSADKSDTIELEQMFYKGVAGLAGAFQTSREIFSNSIWRNIVEFRLFFLIYGHAVFKDDVKLHGLTLHRGQWVRSYRNLQEDLEYIENRSIKRYSLSVIKRAIDGLVNDDRLKIEVCELGTLFEVVNYAKYQGLDNYKKDTKNGVGTEMEQGWNGDGTEKEQQRNKKKNDKKDKNEKKDIYITVQHLSMSKEEYDKLITLYTQSEVDNKIAYAENYAKLKNYKSLYLTLNNWLQAGKSKAPQSKPEQKKSAKQLLAEESDRILKEEGAI